MKKHKKLWLVFLIQLNNVYFGHVRLSIIDTSSESNQPFVYGNTTMIFNGTIWNYRELREELNIETKTSGDTEVLCAILDRYGIEGLNKVQGMFAIAFTQGDGSITIVRDRHGEVPLHYSLLTGLFPSFSFCSEIKGLLAMGEIGQTVKMLEPGSFINVSSKEIVKAKRPAIIIDNLILGSNTYQKAWNLLAPKS